MVNNPGLLSVQYLRCPPFAGQDTYSKHRVARLMAFSDVQSFIISNVNSLLLLVRGLLDGRRFELGDGYSDI